MSTSRRFNFSFEFLEVFEDFSLLPHWVGLGVPGVVVDEEHVVVKKTVQGWNCSTKAWEPTLLTHARQEVPKDELGTSEDPR